MRREKRKPVSTETIAAVGLSAAAIAVFVLFIALSAGSGGNTPALLGGLSIFALIAAIAAFVMGFRARKNENFDRLFRILGVALPLIAVLLWAGLYLLGMFLG
mgnify:FL=1